MRVSRLVISKYEQFFDKDIDFSLIGTESYPLPQFPLAIMIELCELAKSHFMTQNTVLRLDGEMFIFGDLHGNIRDLLRLISSAGIDKKFLFLGDYVDRGEFSIEVISLLFALVIEFPNRVFMIRGNHEFESVNSQYGFWNEVNDVLKGRDLYDAANDAFSYLPLAAIINSSLFCVHGGLSPSLKKIEQIELLERPIIDYKNCKLLEDIMWSDPSRDISEFTTSYRGYGCIFGVIALKDFLVQNNVAKLIRAHQCVKKGIEIFGTSKYPLITVFSTSSYSNESNDAGVLYVSKGTSVTPYTMKMIPAMKRFDASFYEVSLTKINPDSISQARCVQSIRCKQCLSMMNLVTKHNRKTKPLLVSSGIITRSVSPFYGKALLCAAPEKV